MAGEIGSTVSDKSVSRIIEDLSKNPFYKTSKIELQNELYGQSYYNDAPLMVTTQRWQKTRINIGGHITESLSQAGVNIRLSPFQDSHGNTIFHYLSELQDEQRRLEIARLFIQAGLAIDLKNSQQQLPAKYVEFKKIQQEILQRAKGRWRRSWKNENLQKHSGLIEISIISFALAVLVGLIFGLISSTVAGFILGFGVLGF